MNCVGLLLQRSIPFLTTNCIIQYWRLKRLANKSDNNTSVHIVWSYSSSWQSSTFYKKQWRHGRGHRCTKNFSLSENFLLSKNLSKNTKFGAKSTPLGGFVGRINILSTHNVLCQKFAAVVTESFNFQPLLLFLTHDTNAKKWNTATDTQQVSVLAYLLKCYCYLRQMHISRQSHHHTDWSAMRCPWSRYSVATSSPATVIRRRRPTMLMPPRPSGTHPPVLSSRVITCALTRTRQSSLQVTPYKSCS